MTEIIKAGLFLICGCASVTALAIGFRVWRSENCLYERNRQKLLRGETLSNSDIDNILGGIK